MDREGKRLEDTAADGEKEEKDGNVKWDWRRQSNKAIYRYIDDISRNQVKDDREKRIDSG